MSKYYVADDEYEDEIYGSSSKQCLSIETVRHLADGWEMTEAELLDWMHEADADEIEEYGVYDGK